MWLIPDTLSVCPVFHVPVFQVSERPELAGASSSNTCAECAGWFVYPTRIALADFGDFLGRFADRTILLMKNHPLLGSVSLVSCLLLDFRGQASRCVKQTTPGFIRPDGTRTLGRKPGGNQDMETRETWGRGNLGTGRANPQCASARSRQLQELITSNLSAQLA
jgi:hypothetical protein